MYRGSREEYYLVIELIRQFYTEPRSFRMTGTAAEGLPEPEPNSGYQPMPQRLPNSDYRFILYSNAGIVDKDTMLPDGTVRHVRPAFDIMVTAEKQSPFNRAAQNETAKELYNAGMFAPENALPALACLDMMDFEGKDKVTANIQQNSLIMQQLQAAMQMIQNQAMVDPAFGMMAMDQGLIDPEAMMQMQTQQPQAPAQTRPAQAEAGESSGMSYADKIRKRSAEAASPQ